PYYGVWTCGLVMLAWRLGSQALLISAYLLRSFSRLRFLPPRVRTLHPSGVLGIYATSSGCCVTFHQPLRDVTVKERSIIAGIYYTQWVLTCKAKSRIFKHKKCFLISHKG